MSSILLDSVYGRHLRSWQEHYFSITYLPPPSLRVADIVFQEEPLDPTANGAGIPLHSKQEKYRFEKQT